MADENKSEIEKLIEADKYKSALKDPLSLTQIAGTLFDKGKTDGSIVEVLFQYIEDGWLSDTKTDYKAFARLENGVLQVFSDAEGKNPIATQNDVTQEKNIFEQIKLYQQKIYEALAQSRDMKEITIERANGLSPLTIHAKLQAHPTKRDTIDVYKNADDTKPLTSLKNDEGLPSPTDHKSYKADPPANNPWKATAEAPNLSFRSNEDLNKKLQDALSTPKTPAHPPVESEIVIKKQPPQTEAPQKDTKEPSTNSESQSKEPIDLQETFGTADIVKRMEQDAWKLEPDPIDMKPKGGVPQIFAPNADIKEIEVLRPLDMSILVNNKAGDDKAFMNTVFEAAVQYGMDPAEFKQLQEKLNEPGRTFVGSAAAVKAINAYNERYDQLKADGLTTNEHKSMLSNFFNVLNKEDKAIIKDIPNKIDDTYVAKAEKAAALTNTKEVHAEMEAQL